MLAQVCLVGPKGVGKSTIISKFGKNAFTRLLKGTALVNWNVLIGDYEVDLQVWETCGEDRFRSMGPIFYKATDAAVCVFDIASKQSFLDLQAWVISVQQNANDKCIFVLLGNKKDLVHRREVTEQEALKYAESVGATYFEICATSSEGVNGVFRYIAGLLLRQHDCYNSYHAKLAITTSGIGVCHTQKRKRSTCLPCFPCLVIGSS